MDTLPAGYVDLGFMAMHVADLRRHTADIYRFQTYLGLALELEAHEPNTEEYLAVVEKAVDTDALALTCRELAELSLSTASALEASN